MDNTHLKHELYTIAQAVLATEYQMSIIRKSVCSLLGAVEASNKFEDFICTYSPDSHTYSPALHLNNSNIYQGNGFGNQSTSTTLEEIKAMIVELKIKGSVRERPDGRFEYRSAMLGSIYGFTKEEIEEKITQKLKEVKKNKGKSTANQNKTPLLSEFFTTEYLPYKKNQGRSEASIKSYHSLFSYILHAHFDKSLNLYNSKEIEDFLYSIPHSRTRQMLQGFFNNMFKRAIVVGLVKFNPCAAMEKVQHIQEQGTAFSFDEQREFFDTLAGTDKLTYMEKCYFLFVYLTGTRKQEALSVTTNDVDFKNKVLAIRGTKTEGSNRQIPLTPLVEKLLLSLHSKSGAYFPITEYRVERLYNKIRNHHKLHDLRHTYGTIQICVEKVDVKTVSLVMGHSTVNTTLAIYTHPEQLDRGTFLRGDLTAEEKLAIYRSNYREISCQVEQLIQ